MLHFLHPYISVPLAVPQPLFTRYQSTHTGRITNGTTANSHSTALLGSAVPLCTVTLRFNWQLFTDVTLLRVELCVRRLLTRWHAYQQFPASHLPVRPPTVTHCNTQYNFSCKIHCATLLYEAVTWDLDPLAKGIKSINICHESAVCESDRCEILYEIAGGPWLLLERGTEGRNVTCGKCGAVDRALCGGLYGEFFAYGRLLKWNDTTSSWVLII
jgi:hypothetical protein